MRHALVQAGWLLGCMAMAVAAPRRVELLASRVTPASVGPLASLACRDVDRVVTLRLTIDWPGDRMSVETTGYKRLVFWTDQAEYLFPNGHYRLKDGHYVVAGSFVVRSGGIHQGIVSNAFEAVRPGTATPSRPVRDSQPFNARC